MCAPAVSTRPPETAEAPPEFVAALAPPPPGPSVAFVLRLGQALHRHGTPAHRLEGLMMRVSERLGLEARFFSTPTSIFASFGPPEDLRTSLIRVEPGDFDLERLILLDMLADDVIQGRLTPTEGATRVEAILARPPRYGPALQLLCWMLAGASAALLFGGGWKEMGVAGFSSLAIGGLDQLTRKQPTTARVLEPVAAVLSAAFAGLAAHFFGPLHGEVATLAGLIVLLPGLTLTIAVNEVATRNLISGTSRLTHAALVFLQLGFGAALGSRVSTLLPPVPTPPLPTVMPPGAAVVALVVAGFAIAVLFRARPRDWGWIALAGAAAFMGARLGALLLGPQLGAFAGALLLGMGSNALARLRNRPAVTTVVPGLMLLVPGSVGFRSLASLLERDVVAGVDTAFSMLMVAVALAAGLLSANAIMPSRKVL
ncbi:threonine/serine ThrE exporter family protein [Corallococcus aberystwythensis]|uniref:Threonine/serine exporter family protein n=1 Tax=Corallococcus aberystwythensis TaxID=2316722 RepID=A0A3A8PIG0_9BACT|nr:threonine/serine exporter family protein [Corallococcus aberystwythensis]RKH55100.1 threonine/serine exporter family protein [Corallococcus aberystwythensis]